MRETLRNSPSAVLAVRHLRRDPSGSNIRDFGTGAQILQDLGVRDMILLNSSEHPLAALRGYGLSILERRTMNQPPSRP